MVRKLKQKRVKVLRTLKEENYEKMRLEAFRRRESQSKFLDFIIGEWKC